MRKITTIVSVLLLTFCLSLSTAFAQSPEKMSYQAVVRDASNTLVTSTNVGMQVSILQGSVVGAPVYTEIHTVATNLNGLVSLEIGTGTIISGNFAAINWTNGPYFIKTETDPTGGTNYTITGINQLLSVPYALHAKTADNAINDLVDDADSDSSNELQTLSINLTNDTVFLSDGGFIYLSPALGDNWGSESVNTLGVNITGNGTVANPLVVIDNDTSASNEIELPGTANTNEMLMWNGTAWVAADVCSLFTFFYADTDGDGFGNPLSAVDTCRMTPPTGYVVDDSDCNDIDPNINISAIEICDGIDNDKDGLIDEGFDADSDGIADCFDNCPDRANPNQEPDADCDGVPTSEKYAIISLFSDGENYVDMVHKMLSIKYHIFDCPFLNKAIDMAYYKFTGLNYDTNYFASFGILKSLKK